MWLQRPGLIVYLDPSNDKHKSQLVEDPEFQNIRFRVVEKAKDQFKGYQDQLSKVALACYYDLPESYWNPSYIEPEKTIWDYLYEIFINIEKNKQICAEMGSGCDQFR